MVRVYGPGGKEPVDMKVYMTELLRAQHDLCPVTLDETDIEHGHVLWSPVGNQDYFVSNEGIKLLKGMYGDDFVLDKLVLDNNIDDYRNDLTESESD